MRRHTKIMVYDLRDRRLITLPTQESGSHYVWNNRNQLIASCIINGNSCHVLYDMKDVDHYQIIAGDVLNSDGHQSFISDTSFVADTYPDKYRMAKIYKADINTQSADLLLSIYSPKEFQTKDFKCHIACDLHPRVSPSGKYHALIRLVLENGVVYNAIVGTGYVGKVSYTIKIKKNICGLAKSKYICGGNYRAMAVNQYDRSYDNMFILYNNEEGRYIIFS